jgi:hypothetical protein
MWSVVEILTDVSAPSPEVTVVYLRKDNRQAQRLAFRMAREQYTGSLMTKEDIDRVCDILLKY